MRGRTGKPLPAVRCRATRRRKVLQRVRAEIKGFGGARECRAHLARLRSDALTARREIEEARRLYAEMGATAQVERLAKEMDGDAGTLPGS